MTGKDRSPTCPNSLVYLPMRELEEKNRFRSSVLLFDIPTVATGTVMIEWLHTVGTGSYWDCIL